MKIKIPVTVWAICLATALINLSTMLIFSFSAVYLQTVVGTSTRMIGVLEGIVDGCNYLVKLFSGVLSDFLQRRKGIVVAGFALAAAARPMIAVSAGYWSILTGRMLDRIGNGIQSSPRDALVSDVAPVELRGRCFGLRHACSNVGSFLGGVTGFIIMKVTGNNIQAVFWVAVVPACIGLLLLILLVKDVTPSKEQAETIQGDADSGRHEQKEPGKRRYHPIRWSDLPRLGRNYWLLMAVSALFLVSRISESFLILHASNTFALSLDYVPFIMMLNNGATALISYPFGYLADRYNRYILLGIGFFVMVLADLVLALAGNLAGLFCGIALWGIQVGMTQSTMLTLITDEVPEDLRGTGIGFYYLIQAASAALASSGAGHIIDMAGHQAVYMASAGIAMLSLMMMGLFLRRKRV